MISLVAPFRGVLRTDYSIAIVMLFYLILEGINDFPLILESILFLVPESGSLKSS
jgi:hypothetical protein